MCAWCAALPARSRCHCQGGLHAGTSPPTPSDRGQGTGAPLGWDKPSHYAEPYISGKSTVGCGTHNAHPSGEQARPRGGNALAHAALAWRRASSATLCIYPAPYTVTPAPAGQCCTPCIHACMHVMRVSMFTVPPYPTYVMPEGTVPVAGLGQPVAHIYIQHGTETLILSPAAWPCSRLPPLGPAASASLSCSSPAPAGASNNVWVSRIQEHQFTLQLLPLSPSNPTHI